MTSNYVLRESLTICAPITAPATAGVAVIRVSGPESLAIVRRLADFLPTAPESHRVYYGIFGEKSAPIDETLITYFEKGRSFTGDETVEISFHGSLSIQSEILNKLIFFGCSPALRGEFSFRAFNSGRIDLIQAESVLTLINSQTKEASRIALRQLTGDLSRSVHEIEKNVLWVLANIEAGIDFSTEDIDVINREEINNRVNAIVSEVKRLVGSYHKTRPLIEGLRVTLLGAPNAGKSSLFNALLDQNRAIVTEIPGTTRDAIEAELRLPGGRVSLVDTAGLRSTEDQIEKLGIEISKNEAIAADLIFYLFDLTAGLTAADREILSSLPKEKTIIIGTKADLINLEKNRVESPIRFCVSARNKESLNQIKDFLSQNLTSRMSDDSAVIIQKRHFDLLTEAAEKAVKAMKLLQESASYEFVALELQESLKALYELLGKEYDDQVMDRVFKEFCIGK